MMPEDAYRILEVEPGASPKEVQLAYRKKALELHPDRASSEEQSQYFYRQFLEIRDAYEYLRREGFPVPEPELVVPDVVIQTWTAGRSFAPKKGETNEVSQLQKLGFDFNFSPKVILFWGIFLPGCVAFLGYFIKWLMARLHGEP